MSLLSNVIDRSSIQFGVKIMDVLAKHCKPVIAVIITLKYELYPNSYLPSREVLKNIWNHELYHDSCYQAMTYDKSYGIWHQHFMHNF